MSRDFVLISGDSSYHEAILLGKKAIHIGLLHKYNMIEDIINIMYLIKDGKINRNEMLYNDYYFDINNYFSAMQPSRFYNLSDNRASKTGDIIEYKFKNDINLISESLFNLFSHPKISEI